MTKGYKLALNAVREATQKYAAICKSYRDGGIGDDEFLKAKAEYHEAEKVYDAAFTKESKGDS